MRLSIITINYNNAAELEKTIASVATQTWKAFEYIVIDGGSTDNSISVIKKYESSIQYWVSEKDKGIYHAMNKGIEKAKGDYLFMLNAGDALASDDILQTVFEENNYTEDILYGNIKWFSKGVFVRESNFPQQLSFQYFWYRSLGHQAAFIKRSIHDIIGLYDETLKFGSDWKLFVLAICKYHCSMRHLQQIISDCDCDGLTWRPSNFPAMKREKEDILKVEFPLFYNDYKDLEEIKANQFDNKMATLKNNLKKKIKKIIPYKKKK